MFWPHFLWLIIIGSSCKGMQIYNKPGLFLLDLPKKNPKSYPGMHEQGNIHITLDAWKKGWF